MPTVVTIIIPNWNGLRHLERCLRSLQHQTYPHCHILLVDNGSTDVSCQFVSDNYPQVEVVRSSHNLGFAGGTNLGIRHCDTEFVATLNNDTEVEPEWLEHLVGAISARPDHGMAASKLLFDQPRDIINSAGIALDRAGYAWDRQGGSPDTRTESPHDVFGPCAGAALYRRQMLDAIGLFDEDFFGYLEDVDLAWRAQALGWRCVYEPAARVYHVHSATGVEGSPLKSYLLGRNKWWTILKNYPSPQLLLFFPLILLYDLMGTTYALLSRGEGHAIRGRLAAFLALPRVWAKRRSIQSSRGYDASRAFQLLEPVPSPYDLWQRYRHLQARRVASQPG